MYSPKKPLLDAQRHPEKYPQLTVRVSGYAVNFIKLTKAQQDEVISAPSIRRCEMAAQVTAASIRWRASAPWTAGRAVRGVFAGMPHALPVRHNPDTWDPGGGVPTTVEELLAQYARNEAFYRKGGITVTGGEPLLQIEFVTALFREAKRRGIHTCLDTSGATFRPEDAAALAQFDALCAVTDLVLLDIKQTDPAAHRRLTGRENGNILAFARYLAQKEVPVWVRHVVVPGLTDSEAGWKALGTLLASLPNVRALDVLPYHTMGRSKYDALGIPYPLEGTPAAEAPLAARARDVILAARRAALEKPGGRAEE